MNVNRSFTGHPRRRLKTRWSVWLGEILSRLLITVGGIGTIVAVALVCVFLVWVVYPLFLGATARPAGNFLIPAEARPLRDNGYKIPLIRTIAVRLLNDLAGVSA